MLKMTAYIVNRVRAIKILANRIDGNPTGNLAGSLTANPIGDNTQVENTLMIHLPGEYAIRIYVVFTRHTFMGATEKFQGCDL
jgi:hypothetical protein